MSITGSFDADDRIIKDVLFSNEKYLIPRYQRPYAWEEDQISEFWNDLVSDDDSFFLGSLILNFDDYKKTDLIEIIDGQQRLLTITIFIAVLRDIAETIDEATARRYHEQDIAIVDRNGRETFRIIPGDSTRDFFEKYIQNKDNKIMEANATTLEHEKIKRNYIYFYAKVLNEINKFENKSDQLKYLDKLRDKIANLVVIHIQIESEEDAYDIFEATNARGVDLSVADLLKNLIFKRLPPTADRDFAKDMWEDITNNIQATDTELKKFIRYYWISKYSFIQERRLFKEIKKQITDHKTLLEDLWDSAQWYAMILESSKDEWKDIKNGDKIYKSIAAIRLMNVTQCNVLFLSILRNINRIKTDPTRIFKLVEKFTFQYSAICSQPGNKVEKIYSKYAIKIEDTIKNASEKQMSGKIQAIFSELEKELKEEAPSQVFFNDKFAKLSCRNSEKSRKITKYILAGIDGLHRDTDEEEINFDKVNIEHILPQTPNRSWGLSKEQIKPYVNKIGNLTLVDVKINSSIGNKVIKDKIVELQKSGLPITKKLVEELTTNSFKWDEYEITKRQNSFAELAYTKIWNL